jgi:asparagine synthase (glutamine-hydrolysing)
MSIIFGLRKPLGDSASGEELLELAAATGPYALDGTFLHAVGCVGMGFQPYHTTDRSHLEVQPLEAPRGTLIVFDGRLDNYAALSVELGTKTTAGDSSIALAAFERWGERCFSKLVGDWAIALYIADQHTLYLARDHAGTRTLFYRNVNGTFLWSTHLETLIAKDEHCSPDDHFLLDFFNSRPNLGRTPFQGIHAVLPSQYLVIQNNQLFEKRHWEWVKKGLIRYRSDTEYEEHFLSLFEQSVRRRTGPGAEILAQLSGGMDSTSIVCMSDHIRRSEGGTTKDLVDTLSFYDDTEPNWDERHYFSITEQARGKTGIHIDLSSQQGRFVPIEPSSATSFIPGQGMSVLLYEQLLKDLCAGRDYRVILSGIGGDELLGGVPTPLPELADYLATAQFPLLLSKAMLWSISSKTSILPLLGKTVQFLFRTYTPRRANQDGISFLGTRLRKVARVSREQIADLGGFGWTRPSVMSTARAWWSALRSSPHLQPAMLTRHEYRYPYLDRDLVDFLMCVPREQLTRPGRRRSLMRRTLRDIVPFEILERKRKAFVARSPIAAIQQEQESIASLLADPLVGQYKFLDARALRTAFDHILNGRDLKSWPWLWRGLALELWLRNVSGRLALTPEKPPIKSCSPLVRANDLRAG